MSKIEEWRAAPGFPNYEVSSLGRVRRLTTSTSTVAGRILKACLHYRGYLHHGLTRDGKTVTVRLNRLVCAAFHGEAPSVDHEAAHRDGDKLNNCADNLYWASHADNEADKARHGTHVRGSKMPNAVLNEGIVRDARSRWPRETIKALAAEYGVGYNVLSQALHGHSWRHVDQGNQPQAVDLH